ncbi:MAG: hypothetical protein ACPGED_01455 [Flavobacteriales bacterium]
MENLVKAIGRYVISILLIVFGLMFLLKFAAGDAIESQPADMIIAALVLILVGVITMPFVLSKMSRNATRILTLVGFASCVFLTVRLWQSIDSEMKFLAKKERIDATVIQRLKDIRQAQISYKEINGNYTNDMSELKTFINSKIIPIPFKTGVLDTTAEAAMELGKIISKSDVDSVAQSLEMSPAAFEARVGDIANGGFQGYEIRDTTYSSFYDLNFKPHLRVKKRLPNVNLDSLGLSPASGQAFKIDLGRIQTGGVTVPTIRVQDPTPFGREKVRKDTLQFGSTTEAHTDGNWKD